MTNDVGKDLIKQIMDLLPDDTKVLGFSTDSYRGIDFIGVTSKEFPECPPGQGVSEITVELKRTNTELYVSRLFIGTDPNDMNTIQWISAPVAKISVSGNALISATRTEIEHCEHLWERYTGLYQSFEHCKHCGEKKE